MRKYVIDFSNIDEVLKLLRGEYQLLAPPMDVGEVLPTATNQVLTDYVYKNKNNKNIFQKAIISLLNGSAADVYLGLIYFSDCLFFEERNLSAFSIDKELLIPKIKIGVNKYAYTLDGSITFTNGTTNKNPMRYIKILDRDFKSSYGFSIFE